MTVVASVSTNNYFILIHKFNLLYESGIDYFMTEVEISQI